MIFTSRREGIHSAREEAGVEVLREAVRWDWGELQGTLQRGRQEAGWVVHLQYHAASFPSGMAMCLAPWRIRRRFPADRPRIVVTLHELAGPPYRFLPKLIRRAALLPLVMHADAVVVTNRRDLRVLSRVPFLGSKLRWIPLGSNVPVTPCTETERREIRERLGVRPHERLLVRYGFLRNPRWIFLPQLLRTVQQLLRKGHRARLLLIGDATEAALSFIRSAADRLGVSDRLILTGHLPADQVSRYLQASEIAIQCYPEGVSERRSSLLTVLHHGLPVISNSSGQPDAPFLHRQNIFLVPRPSPDQMAQGVIELISQPPLRSFLGRGALKAMADYSWERAGKETDELYRLLLKGRGE